MARFGPGRLIRADRVCSIVRQAIRHAIEDRQQRERAPALAAFTKGTELEVELRSEIRVPLDESQQDFKKRTRWGTE